MENERLCSRPGCSHPAVATLKYNHARKTGYVMPLIDEEDPHSWDLCARHAQRVSVPQGWELIRQEVPAQGAAGGESSDLGVGADDGRVVRLASVRQVPPASRAVRELTDTISRLDRKKQVPPAELEDAAELEAYEQSLVSPLVEEARARAKERRQWRGRGEEVVVRSSPVAGQAEGAVASTSSGEESAAPWRRDEDDVVVHHPALKNLPGRRRYQLHSVPSGRSD